MDITFKYIMFYSKRNSMYKLAKVKSDNYYPKNKELLWSFEEDQLKQARKVVDKLNSADPSKYPNAMMAS